MIRTNNLEKSFGPVKALDHLTLSIQEGQVFGLIGTNGAGKSTLLRILAGVLRPDRGTAEIDGETLHIRARQAAAASGKCNSAARGRMTSSGRLVLRRPERSVDPKRERSR